MVAKQPREYRSGSISIGKLEKIRKEIENDAHCDYNKARVIAWQHRWPQSMAVTIRNYIKGSTSTESKKDKAFKKTLNEATKYGNEKRKFHLFLRQFKCTTKKEFGLLVELEKSFLKGRREYRTIPPVFKSSAKFNNLKFINKYLRERKTYQIVHADRKGGFPRPMEQLEISFVSLMLSGSEKIVEKNIGYLYAEEGLSNADFSMAPDSGESEDETVITDSDIDSSENDEDMNDCQMEELEKSSALLNEDNKEDLGNKSVSDVPKSFIEKSAITSIPCLNLTEEEIQNEIAMAEEERENRDEMKGDKKLRYLIFEEDLHSFAEDTEMLFDINVFYPIHRMISEHNKTHQTKVALIKWFPEDGEEAGIGHVFFEKNSTKNFVLPVLKNQHHAIIFFNTESNNIYYADSLYRYDVSTAQLLSLAAQLGMRNPRMNFFGEKEVEKQTLGNSCGVHVVALCHNYLQNFEEFPLRSVNALMLRKQIEAFNKEMFRIQEERKTNNKVHEEQNLENKPSQSDLLEDWYQVEQSPKRQEFDSFPDFDCRDLDYYQSEALTDQMVSYPNSIDELSEEMEHSESSTSAEASPHLPNNENNSNEDQKAEKQDSKRADCSEILQAMPKRSFRDTASRRNHEQKKVMRRKQAEKKEAELLRERELKEMEEPTHQVLHRYRKESKASFFNLKNIVLIIYFQHFEFDSDTIGYDPNFPVLLKTIKAQIREVQEEDPKEKRIRLERLLCLGEDTKIKKWLRQLPQKKPNHEFLLRRVASLKEGHSRKIEAFKTMSQEQKKRLQSSSSSKSMLTGKTHLIFRNITQNKKYQIPVKCKISDNVNSVVIPKNLTFFYSERNHLHRSLCRIIEEFDKEKNKIRCECNKGEEGPLVNCYENPECECYKMNLKLKELQKRYQKLKDFKPTLFHTNRPIILNPNFAFNTFGFACSSECGCESCCTNNVTLHLDHKVSSLEIVRENIQTGFEVETNCFLPAGIPFNEFTGSLVPCSNTVCAEYSFTIFEKNSGLGAKFAKILNAEDDLKRMLMETYQKQWVIDPENMGNVARMLGHSCEPNIALVVVFQKGLSPAHARYLMVPLVDIFPTTKITFDYGESYYSQNLIDVCTCQTMSCRNNKTVIEEKTEKQMMAELEAQYTQDYKNYKSNVLDKI